MTTFKERSEIKNKVVGLIQKVKAENLDDLIRSNDFSRHVNLEPIRPILESWLDLAARCDEGEVDIIPAAHLIRLDTGLRDILAFTGRLKSLDPQDANINTQIVTTIEEVQNSHDDILEKCSAAVSVGIQSRSSRDYVRTEMERAVESFNARVKQTFKDLVKTQKQAEAIVEALQDATSLAAVGTQAKIFMEEADKHVKASRKWRNATITMLSVTGLITIGFLLLAVFVAPEFSTVQLVQVGVSKVVVLSVFSLATFWCARHMRSRMHNSVLNSHRSNALRTVRAFTEGAGDDPELKRTLILHCAQAAFRDHPTGFESSSSKEDATGARLAEIAMKVATSRVGGG